MARYAIARERLPKNRVGSLRDERGLTNDQVGTAIGRTASVVSRYATGRYSIPDDVKIDLSDYFDVSIQYLMGWDALGGCNTT